MIAQRYFLAVENLNKALQLNSVYVPSILNLGTAYAGLGKYTVAISYYNKVIEIEHPKVNNNIESVNEITRNNLKDAYLYSGLSHLEIGQTEKAIIKFYEALELNANNYFIYYNLGKAYEITGKLDLAIKNYILSINMNGRFKKVYYKLGKIYIKYKNMNDALHSFKMLIKLPPIHKKDSFILGKLFMEIKNFSEAIAYLNVSVNIDQYFKEAYRLLGICYMALDKVNQAISYFKRVLRIDPSYLKAVSILDFAMYIKKYSYKSLNPKKMFLKRETCFSYNSVLYKYT